MTKTSRALRLAAVPVAALLLLGACSATYDEEVDPTDPASVAAAIIGYTAHEQFDEACEYSSDDPDECKENLESAHARWTGAGLLEQARAVTAEHFYEINHGVREVNESPGFSTDGSHWKPTYRTDDDEVKLSTVYLG